MECESDPKLLTPKSPNLVECGHLHPMLKLQALIFQNYCGINSPQIMFNAKRLPDKRF